MFFGPRSLRKNDVDFAPVISRRGALIGPVDRIVQVVRDLGRPSAAEMAIEQVAFDRLTKPGCSPRDIHFPPGCEVERTAHWIVNPPFTTLFLQSLHVARYCNNSLLHLLGLAVNRSHGIHKLSPPYFLDVVL